MCNERENKRKRYGVSYVLCLFLVLLIICLTGIVIYQFYSMGRLYQMAKEQNDLIVSSYTEVLEKLERISALSDDEFSQEAVYVFRDLSDYTPYNDSEKLTLVTALEMLSNRFESFKADWTMLLTLFALMITVITMAIPVFNFTFLQKQQITELEKRTSGKLEEFREEKEEAFGKLNDFYESFKNEMTDFMEQVSSGKEQLEVIINNGIESIEDRVRDKSPRMQAENEKEASFVNDNPIMADKNIKDDKAKALDLYLKGLREFNNENYKASVDLFTEAIDRNKDADCYFMRSRAYFHIKEYQKAVDDCTKAIGLNPDNAELYRFRSVYYNWLNEYQKAVDDCNKAIGLSPNNARYYNDRGQNFGWLNEYQKAVADYTKAIELNPDKAEYYYGRGIYYSWLNEYQKAVDDYTKAMTLDPKNAIYPAMIAYPLYKIGETELAFSRLKLALEIDNGESIAYRNLGKINLKLAKKNKEKCKPDVLFNLDKAIELEHAKDRIGVIITNYLTRAEYYLYTNEPDKAYSDLQQVLHLHEYDESAYFYLSKYYEMTGDSTEQERCYQKALALGFIEEDDN